MKLVAILSHFAESPTMLAATVASLSKLKVDHLVAVDGAYRLMPDGRGSSGVDQTRAITDTAEALGIGLTLHHLAQAERYRGDEVEKRNVSLRLALAVTTSDDWLFIIDGDEVVDTVLGDPRQDLAETELDVATCTIVKRLDTQKLDEAWIQKACMGGLDSMSPRRGFFRALPGLRYEANHYTVMDGDRVLTPPSPLSVDALELGSVFLDHRNHLRDSFRSEKALEYYRRRDEFATESVA